jgi:hypothetical protein
MLSIVDSPAEAEARETEMNARLDDYRTEVIAKAVGRLRAVPVTCTALTGPVWYGAGWNDAIRTLEEIADYQTPDDEAYPGELQRLRALALGLRVAALRKEDLAEAQRLLVSHAEHEIEARDQADRANAAAPEFFEVDHAYQWRGDEFRVLAVDPHPIRGDLTAVGWLIETDGTCLIIRMTGPEWESGKWVEVTR